jgi:putative ABC transport system permease protein
MHSFLFSIRIALDSLWSHRLRTVLSTLGVIIGVGALVAVLAMGDGAERYARQQIEETTNLKSVIVTPHATRSVDGHRVARKDVVVFDADDVTALREILPTGTDIAVGTSGSGLAGLDASGDPRGVTVVARCGLDLDPERWVVTGRELTRAEQAGDARLAVVSANLAAALTGAEVGESLIGGSLVIGEAILEVIGLAAPLNGGNGGDSFVAWVPLGITDAVMVPRAMPRPVQLILETSTIESVDPIVADVETWLAARYSDWEDRVEITTNRYRIEQTQRGMLIFKLLMGSIAGVSLLVGGIGIMNVLLSSVLERTREIGVRKAVGARRRDIVGQFLVESVTITAVGSGLGIALGFGVALVTTAFMRARTEATIYAAVTPGSIAVALALALVVGLVFGLYPAIRASRLSPIDAIRHD